MKSHAKGEFIQLRAKGLSFDKISNELNISKPTLLKWNEELEKEITHCSYLEIEAILEQYRLMKLHKIEIFSLILEKSIEELKIGQKSYTPSIRPKQREELHLRGLLICPSCNRNLTGSRYQSRSGQYYFYYYCQNSCKTRFNADVMHEKLHDHLKSLTLPYEICDLYMAILEDTSS